MAKLGTLEPLWVTVPRGRSGDVKPVAKHPEPLMAPLEQGQRVGTLSLMMEDKLLRTTPLDVLESVQQAGFFGRMVDTVKMWLQ